MTDLDPAAQRGRTPLTPEESAALIPTHITTRGELDEVEADNIAEALQWLGNRRATNSLSIAFAKELHRRMYGNVWAWAGAFSLEYNRRLGVDANQIESELRILCDNVAYRIKHDSRPDKVELLAEYHHRLTVIHPFPNGNGRWARLMTDLLAGKIEMLALAWGGHPTANHALHSVSAVARDAYVEALRSADRHDHEPLIALIRAWSV